jgi:AcrR family transcriptional regulator
VAQPLDRREVILREAAELFARQGVAATTVREIADAAGILSGSLYHHFTSKDEIVDAVVSSFLHDLRAAYDEV